MGTLAKAPTAEQARATWQAGESSAMAGALDPATAEKASKGDVSVIAEVDAFLATWPRSPSGATWDGGCSKWLFG